MKIKFIPPKIVKHITFVTPSMFCGGAERVMSILMNELVRRNYKVSLIYMNDTHTLAYSFSDKINTFFIKDIKFDSIFNFIIPIKELRDVLKEIRPDVIISFFSSALCYSWLAQLGLNIPIIFSERNDPYNNIKGLKAHIFQKMALAISSKIVFQTQGARAFYKSKKIQKKSVIIHNPLNFPIKEANVCIENHNIVSVGRLSSQKNQKMLIDAVSRLNVSYPDLTLTIYGEGKLRGDLEQQIQSLGLSDRIFLCGNQQNVIDKIANARMFVFSSNYEGIPNALLEAMSIGLPCVSTDCSPGGAREFIKNYENGILVPCNDVDAMVNAIDYHFKNPEKSKLMGRNAMKIARQLKVEIIVDYWIRIF